MYIPRANEEQRIPVLHDLIRSQPFGTLITMGGHGLIASHLPMVLESSGEEDAFGTLRAHVSRANPQWRDFDATIDALAIFAGHHHYISASWYPGAKETGAEVPTWNYVVVHAYGTLRAIEDKDWLLAHVSSLTDIHEAASAEPWKVSDAPESYLNSQINGIIGFELPIRRLEGKWKVSQNRNERDRSAVVKGLDDLNTPDSLAMKHLVESRGKN
jgi:transcriptional regulator